MTIHFREMMFLIILMVNAQNQNAQVADNQKFVEVTGKAEIKFTPDQIKYGITMSTDVEENLNDINDDSWKKAQEFKDKLKKNYQQNYLKVWNILEAEGIDEKAIVNEVTYNFGTKNSYDFTNKSIVVKFDNFAKFKKVVEKLKIANICSGQITDVTKLKMRELEDEAQKLAIEDARKQAEKLASSTSSKLGKVLQIKEFQSPLADLFGERTKSWTSYPPLTAVMQDTYFVMGNIEAIDNGEFVLKKAITLRFSLEN